MEDTLDDRIMDVITDADPTPAAPAAATPDSAPVAATPDPAAPAATPDPAAAAAQPVDEDDFDTIPEREPGTGRFSRIPWPKVKTMIGKKSEAAVAAAVAAREAELRKTFGFADDAPVDFTPVTTKLKDYDARVQQMQQFETALMAQDVTPLMEFFAQQNPAFKRYLDAVAGGGATPAAPAGASPAGFPEPDVDLGDGRKTYSVDGLKKIVDYSREQGREQAVKDAEARFEARLRPIEQERATKARIEQGNQIISALQKEAATWPQFAEHEKEILAKMQTLSRDYNPREALLASYQAVVLPKILAQQQTNETELRKKIIAEMNKTPTSTAAATATSGVAAAAPPGDALDAKILGVIQQLG